MCLIEDRVTLYVMTATANLGFTEKMGKSTADTNDEMELTSRTDDDVIKRFPILGPTRKQTELFFWDKQDKPRTADPIRHRNSYLSSNYFTKTENTSINRPFSSNNDLNSQHSKNDHWLRQSSRPPRSNTVLSKPTIQTSKSASVSTEPLNRTFQSYDGISKHGISLLTHWPQDDGSDTPPRYCIINSIGNSKNSAQSHESSGSPAKRSTLFKDVLNQKQSNSYVLTADTSLLVQSRSVFGSRSSSAANDSRTRAKSAIQKVSEANYKSYLKSKSAGVRLLRSRSKHYKSEKNSSLKSSKSTPNVNSNVEQQRDIDTNLSGNSYNAQENSSSIDNRSVSPHSSNFLKRYPSDNSFQSQDQRKVLSGSRQNLLSTQPSSKVVPAENQNQNFLVVQRASTQQQSTKPRSATRDSSSPMAARRKHDFSYSNGTLFPSNKISTVNVKNKDKTLTPSKHGFHPRSHSPTFKRLVAAVERLNETTATTAPTTPLSNSTEDGFDDNTSTDSHTIFRNFKDSYALNDITFTDSESEGNSRKTSEPRTSKATRRHDSDRSTRSKMLHYQGETRQSREKRSTRTLRDKHSPRHCSMARDFTPDEVLSPAELPSSEETISSMVTKSTHDSKTTKEPETRIQEGQPTQLHFFLPQLADSMSEVSGATMTARSHYKERLDLLSRNENNSCQDTTNDITTNGSKSRGRYQNGCVNNSKNPQYLCDKSAAPIAAGVKYQSKLKNPSQNLAGDKLVVNGSGERCLQREIRNGQWSYSTNGRLSPNKEDSSRNKRYVSPVRNKNSTALDKTARRKPASNNNNSILTKPVSYGHDYLDSQLPSEKLKKQIDNFPTLVSMEFSESPTPSQVR